MISKCLSRVGALVARLAVSVPLRTRDTATTPQYPTHSLHISLVAVTNLLLQLAAVTGAAYFVVVVSVSVVVVRRLYSSSLQLLFVSPFSTI